jgi:hypothetical protein
MSSTGVVLEKVVRFDFKDQRLHKSAFFISYFHTLESKLTGLTSSIAQ